MQGVPRVENRGMLMMRALLKTGVLALSIAAVSAHASIENARKFMTGLVELANISKAKSGASDESTSGKVQELSSHIDFTALAKKSFGAKWAKFPEAERKEFLKTLQELLEVVAYPNAKKIAVNPEALVFEEAPAKKGQVKVIGKVTREKKGELVNQNVEVVLLYDKADKVVDAVLEGELLSANLKKQFTEALKKQSFAQIIEKMKKRVWEAREGKGGTKK